MDGEPTDAGEMPDYKLNGSLQADSAEELEGLSIQNQRLARIDEYEESAVARAEPFAAMIGMGNATLQRIFERLGSAVLNDLDNRPNTVEALRELSPEIRLLAKLRNSIETDFALQPPEADREVTAFPRRVKSKGLHADLRTGRRDVLPKRRMNV